MPEPEPDYACVILRLDDGRFVVEARPPDARHAAGQWTCFGGRREPGERALDTARRELDEELGWAPDSLAPAVDLWVGGRFIARFFAAPPGVPLDRLRPEPGRAVTIVDETELQAAPLSSWHRDVLAAFLAGRARVDR